MLGGQRSIPRRIILLGMLLAFCATAQADIIISTTNKAKLGGLRFRDGDLIEYDLVADTATLFFSEDLFVHNEDIDAVCLLENGHIILSTRNSARLGGLRFRDGDLVEYDPVAGTATLFFSEDLFSRHEDIDAVCLLDNGHIILSTTNPAKLGGLRFRDGDLIEYDPVADTATLFLSEDLFVRNEDIDAVHLLSGGELVLSTGSGARLGGLKFKDGDLVEYDPVADTATLFLSEDLFSRNEDINAYADTVVGSPPEPATLLLLIAGGVTLLRRRTRTRA